MTDNLPDILSSPDGRLRFHLTADAAHLQYAVTFQDRPVIETSPLTFTVDGAEITSGVEIGDAQRYQVRETYPWRGVHSRAVNHANGATISLRHRSTSLRYTLEVRVFDDAVAFRTIVPGDPGQRRVPDEATTFRLPAGSVVWYHDFEGHYEGAHVRKGIGDVQDGEWAAPPVTFKLPGGAGYASITEAALVGYSGMGLQADGQRGFRLRLGHAHPPSYPFTLRYGNEEAERLSAPAAVVGEIVSPWRAVLVGRDLNTLVNCDVVHNLCAPPEPGLFPQGLDTEWIRPGRAVWRYLDGGENTLAEMKEFCRLAGELGFEHHVVEGFWRRWDDTELRELVDCGREHSVGIWLWQHSKELRDPQGRRAFFQRCRDAGAAGVKIDFFDHEHKELIDLYQTLLRETAEHRLLVNFHGANKPTGEPRTWPHELTREGVKGMEYRRFQDRARHDTTLPFTRWLAGHADYTPVLFNERRADTTWAHQIATAAILTSPLLTYGAHPQTLLDHPATAMIRSIPSVWDETRVLPISEIGEIAAFARRTGDTWFLAILNGPTARSIEVPLTFLGAGDHQALIVHDSLEDPAAVRVETGTARIGNAMTITLGDGGGFIGRFSP